MIKKLTDIFSRKNPLQHYVHHFIIANIGLFFAYLIFGSITVWEVILFFFMAFLPVVDEFFYAVLHYLDEDTCRKIIHLFMGNEFKEVAMLLHTKRKLFTQLILHNFLLYLALWSLMYIFLMLELPLMFYGLAGLLVHLMQDIANDEYELHSLNRWIWPIHFIVPDAS